VTSRWPYKHGSGTHLRSFHVLKALQHVGSVRVVVLDDERKKSDMAVQAGNEYDLADVLDVEQLPNSTLAAKLRWTFDPTSHYPSGRAVSTEAAQQVRRSLGLYDLIWFFKLRSPDMFPNASWPCSVVDIDDVQSGYALANLEIGRAPLERLISWRGMFSWRRRERLLEDRFSVLAVCSDDDRQYLRRLGLKMPIHIIPNGFERPADDPVRCPATPPRIGFIGLFDYPPNSDGIRWFVEECWPLVKRDVPDACLRLVGLGSDGPLKPVGPDIDGLGWLANPSEEISTWSLMAVPIRVGGGTRVKIAQGFSQKCPIVSTSLGAYGYGARNGNEMYLADSAEAFSAACIKIIREPGTAAQMAERAWGKFLETWTWEATRPLVWAAAEDCLRLSPSK
jgi:glycosyltransferase involved in cell wall biosynthesis